jgi:Nucleotidyltransferase of unknown function (DUF6036)
VNNKSGELLDRTRIRELLTELGRRCAARGFSVEMLIVGGAAIALVYGERRATRDLDAIFEPKMEVYAEAKKMADELGLPEDWLNDGVKGLLPDFPDTGLQVTTSSNGIYVIVPSAEYLFAMKATSARLDISTTTTSSFLGRSSGSRAPRMRTPSSRSSTVRSASLRSQALFAEHLPRGRVGDVRLAVSSRLATDQRGASDAKLPTPRAGSCRFRGGVRVF